MAMLTLNRRVRCQEDPEGFQEGMYARLLGLLVHQHV